MRERTLTAVTQDKHLLFLCFDLFCRFFGIFFFFFLFPSSVVVVDFIDTKKSKRIYRTSQKIRIIYVFLESLLSESFLLLGVTVHSPPYLPRMPSNTVLIFGPAVGAAQILIWSHSCVFLPPMSTAIRTSVFSFVGALNTFYIFQIQRLSS